MDILRAWFSAVLLTGLAVGQVTYSVYAHTDLRVVDKVIPAGTDISDGAELGWTDNHPFRRSRADMQVVTTASSVRFRNSVSGNNVIPPVIDDHSIRIRLTSAAPADVTLRVVGSAGKPIFRVDVRNDGIDELTQGWGPPESIYEEALTVPAGGIDIVIEAAASAGFLSYSGVTVVDFSFAPSGTHVSRDGVACGAELTANYRRRPVFLMLNRRFELIAENAPVTPFAFFVLGVTPRNVAIPPLGCELRTDILVPLPATIDPNGRAVTTLSIPEGLDRFAALAQFLAATQDAQQNAIWRTSQVVRLQL